MKKILILGLLLVSHLWGLKEWDGSICTSLNCSDEEQGLVPKIPDDYKPQKGDRVIKVKVENVEGEIVVTEYGYNFIRSNSEKSYRYVDGFQYINSEIFYINYPQYKVAIELSSTKDFGSSVNFFQIFAVNDGLEMIKLFSEFSTLSCYIKDGDSPCPFTKEYILDWIKKQGGQEFFDDACPLYFENQETDSICKEGIIRDRKCEELPCNPFAGCTPCDNETEE